MATTSSRMDPSPSTPESSGPGKASGVKVSVQTAPLSAAPDPQRRAFWLCLGAAALSGVLLWMCFHPLALGTYVGWFALAPFLLLVRYQGKPKHAYYGALLCGTLFFWPALQWMRVADYRMYATWAMLATYCSLYFPAALFILRRLEPWRIPLIVSVPLVWAALEYLRSFLMTGFAWFFLGHTQHDFLPMIQIADFGGVYAVTILVAAVNAILFDIAYQFPEVRAWFHQAKLEPYHCYSKIEILNRGFLADWTFRRFILVETCLIALVLYGAYSYGEYRLGQNRFAPGPVVCLLQSNLDQRIRNDSTRPENDGHSAIVVSKHFAQLCARAVRDHRPAPDLIIWPETSYPSDWYEVSPKLPIDKVPTQWRKAVIEIEGNLKDLGASYTRIPHLLGMNTNVLDENALHRRYNSAMLLTAKGEVEARFDKMHRIPFGEYVPFKDWLPFMSKLSPYDFDYSIRPGDKFTRFPLDAYRFGVLICFEDSDPFLARRYMEESEDGPPVDFLVNMSNDGWFDGTAQHEQHLAMSRFRAIECRRSLVRACNMGVSALIDGNGRVLKPSLTSEVQPPVWMVRAKNGRYQELPLSEWSEYKKVAGVLTVQVPIDRRESLYPLVGDWLPIGCWLALTTVAGVAWYRRRRGST